MRWARWVLFQSSPLPQPGNTEASHKSQVNRNRGRESGQLAQTIVGSDYLPKGLIVFLPALVQALANTGRVQSANVLQCCTSSPGLELLVLLACDMLPWDATAKETRCSYCERHRRVELSKPPTARLLVALQPALWLLSSSHV